MPAIEKTIADHRAQLDALLDTSGEPDVDSLVCPVEQMEHML